MTIVEAPGRDQPISAEAAPVAVFLGRAASGPLSEPVAIASLADYERVFGMPLADSTLGDTLAQFFQHGGRRAVVVRLANNARSSVIDLPTDGEPLRLAAANPGSGERLRVSVDFDRIEPDSERFNLTVQRMDAAGRHITDQELFPRLSVRPGDERFVGNVLTSSSLVRLDDASAAGMLPRATAARVSDFAIDYVGIARVGADGDQLSDYDLIGSDQHSTGLFSLRATEHFDFLYACGAPQTPVCTPTFIFAAERYCAERNAMLVIDSPPHCEDTQDALAWRARDAFQSASIMTYFPTVVHREADPGHDQPAAGALIGLLCKQDEQQHVWSALADNVQQNSAALHRDWLPSTELDSDDALRLLRAGVNPLLTGMQRRLLFPGLVTAANGRDRQRGSLPHQRLVKFVLR
ncbi:MAG: hypothetical protein AAF270_05410, partial [Pseudomonadota bacterium]